MTFPCQGFLRSAEEISSGPPAPADWDARMYAISPASRAFLEELGIWQRLDAARIAPVQAMRVRGDRHSTLDFSAHDSGVAALA